MKVLSFSKWYLKLLCLVTVIFVFTGTSMAQPVLPQRSLTVTPTQPIHFGTFAVTGGVGGTVTVGWDGSRPSPGS